VARSPGVAAHRSLALWERPPAEGSGLAFEAPLRRCRLDYSPASLQRIDAFLDALRNARHPQAAGFVAVAAQQQLLGFLCFYAGEVLGRALGQAPLWLSGEQAATLAPQALADVPPLHRALCARFGSARARDGAPLFLPMAAVCGRLFAAAGDTPAGLADAAAPWWPDALSDAATRTQPLPPRAGQPWPPAWAQTPAPSIATASAPEALHQQALRHLRGEGVPRNPEQARALWQRAADQGHARSQYHLGLMLAKGLGGPVDAAAAPANRADVNARPWRQNRQPQKQQSAHGVVAMLRIYDVSRPNVRFELTDQG